MAAENVIELTEENFQAEVIEADGPVLVDFWAPWCGPCKMLAPTIDELATEYEGKLKVGKCNTDDARQPAINYNIQSLPTVALFKGGEIVDKIIGAQNKARFVEVLDSHLD